MTRMIKKVRRMKLPLAVTTRRRPREREDPYRGIYRSAPSRRRFFLTTKSCGYGSRVAAEPVIGRAFARPVGLPRTTWRERRFGLKPAHDSGGRRKSAFSRHEMSELLKRTALEIRRG